MSYALWYLEKVFVHQWEGTPNYKGNDCLFVFLTDGKPSSCCAPCP